MTPRTLPTRVLLIDEDPSDFDVYSDMLGAVGDFEVEWAGDPATAREALARRSFDVALVDLGHGSARGLELVRAARRQGLTEPLIVLTGQDEGEMHLRAIDAGATDCLAKGGVTPAVLDRSIRYSLTHHATLAELESTRRELQHLQATSSVFLSSMSHDLRTPLSAVIGLAELLRDPDQILDSARRAEMIDTIVESGFEVANLVEDLVTAARHEAGQLKVVAVPVSLAAQVNQALETIGRSFEVPVRGESPRAMADPGRVRQILRNLLTNAEKHGGENVGIELGETGGMARATVIDDGPGVPTEQEETIFGRTDDAGSATTVGIGLSISRELARHMGGDLRYVRVSGSTRFELTLPVQARVV